MPLLFLFSLVVNWYCVIIASGTQYTGHTVIPHCSSLNYRNPMTLKCHINKIIYTILQALNEHYTHCDWKALMGENMPNHNHSDPESGNTHLCILRLAPKQYETRVLDAYTVQYKIFKETAHYPKDFHLVQYLDRPCTRDIRPSDPSIAISVAYYRHHDLQTFVKHKYEQLRHVGKYIVVQELVALGECTQLMSHLFIALQYLSFKFQLFHDANVTLTEDVVSVRHLNGKSNYCFDDMQNMRKYTGSQHTTWLGLLSLAKISWLALTHYAQLCSPHCVMKWVEGNRQYKRKRLLNVLCTEIHNFVKHHRNATGFEKVSFLTELRSKTAIEYSETVEFALVGLVNHYLTALQHVELNSEMFSVDVNVWEIFAQELNSINASYFVF